MDTNGPFKLPISLPFSRTKKKTLQLPFFLHIRPTVIMQRPNLAPFDLESESFARPNLNPHLSFDYHEVCMAWRSYSWA
ncbi:hypothetical protein ES332_A05G380400v1 [Gossypium tomentosum]|uniref:Uncharacterized protein n=1 Tax=Gossypium tomentosum TaxID=34277 RepID=A0A5D2QNY5_GOSTO|nr:hypothetical protein ES332_A05G380400v1 [Gossypium tomentosum]